MHSDPLYRTTDRWTNEQMIQWTTQELQEELAEWEREKKWKPMPAVPFTETSHWGPGRSDWVGTYVRLPERVHLQAEDGWRSYALIQLRTSVECAHCLRQAETGELAVRYGACATLISCLKCVNWHEETACIGHRGIS